MRLVLRQRLIDTPESPWQRYRQSCRDGELSFDTYQLRTLFQLNRLHGRLYKLPKLGWRRWLLHRLWRRLLPRHLYIWGDVGCGKTLLTHLFESCQIDTQVKRLHFHSVMQQVHQALHQRQRQCNPLPAIATDVIGNCRALILDEFVVSDIADAMLLSGLIRAWMKAGIHLIFTSNTPPQDLYRHGIQRQRFMPAIRRLQRHCHVIHLKSHHDYRRHFLTTTPLYLQKTVTKPGMNDSNAALLRYHELFEDGKPGQGGHLIVQGRPIKSQRHGYHSVWFAFEDLCKPPRSQLDYLELAERYDIFLMSDISPIATKARDMATLLMKLIDVLYDQHKLLICSASCAPDAIYPRGQLAQAFCRTRSRLAEMASDDYRQDCLARFEWFKDHDAF